ncbi:hypothetical protein BN946_scf184493.g2 [Trametes cinnabarina]|uniref:DUF6534 domain-containing protein n=1 Tax=Pycnoporus cinnabarinus TaxID=5643 RepID=A0A060SU03_PYCCI|nr:hypothetical protein BN946_scf184493.g2 [Trametes cinnabarina]
MPPPTLGPTYGALLLGVLFSAVNASLFGVTILQTFFYFQQFPSDRAWRKLAVSWLCFLDALHLALSAHFVYHYLVSNYSNPAALLNIVWSFKVRVVIDALVVCSVHTLYTSRLWTLLAIDQHLAPFGKEARRWSQHKVAVHTSASRWLMRNITPWLVVSSPSDGVGPCKTHHKQSSFVVVGYAIAIAMCYETIRLDTFDDMLHTPWATYVPLGTSTVIDAAISGSLCYFLARCRPQSEAASAPVKTLIVYTLNTGVITSVHQLIYGHVRPLASSTIVVTLALTLHEMPRRLNARTVMNPSSAHRTTRQSCLPSSGGTLPRPRSFRDPLDQKGVRFPSFPASDSSLQLTPYVPASFSSLAGGPAPPPASVSVPSLEGALEASASSTGWRRPRWAAAAP